MTEACAGGNAEYCRHLLRFATGYLPSNPGLLPSIIPFQWVLLVEQSGTRAIGEYERNGRLSPGKATQSEFWDYVAKALGLRGLRATRTREITRLAPAVFPESPAHHRNRADIIARPAASRLYLL